MLKKMWDKIFFINDPGKGAFWSLLLMFAGIWICATLFLLTSGIQRSAIFINRLIRHNFRSDLLLKMPWQSIFILAGIIFIIHFFWQNLRLAARINRWKIILTAGVYILLTGILFRKSLAIWLILTVLLYGFGGLIFKYRKWKAILIHGIVFSAFAGCVYAVSRIIIENWICDNCSGGFQINAAAASQLPVWSCVAAVLLAIWLVCAGWQYSVLTEGSFKEVFSKRSVILVGVWVFCYIALVTASLIAGKLAQNEFDRLGEHFRMPVTANAFSQCYSHNRRTDDGFWKKADNLIRSNNGGVDNEIGYEFAEFTPEQLDSWRQKFFSKEQYAEINRMTSTPLPMHMVKFRQGHILIDLFTADYVNVRSMARCQLWQLRFATESKDRQAVLSALQRLNNISDYLTAELSLLPQLIKFAIETYRIKALRTVFAAKILNENDLLELKKSCRTAREKLPEQEKMSVFGEAVFSYDLFYTFRNGGSFIYNKESMPMKNLRFFLPQFWLLFEVNLFNCLKQFRNAETLYDAGKHDTPNTIFYNFPLSFRPAFNSAGDRFVKAGLEQRALEFFIDQELYFLKHGKYEENPRVPQDPFTGKPMIYSRGKVTEKREVFPDGTREVTFPARSLSSPPGAAGIRKFNIHFAD